MRFLLSSLGSKGVQQSNDHISHMELLAIGKSQLELGHEVFITKCQSRFNIQVPGIQWYNGESIDAIILHQTPANYQGGTHLRVGSPSNLTIHSLAKSIDQYRPHIYYLAIDDSETMSLASNIKALKKKARNCAKKDILLSNSFLLVAEYLDSTFNLEYLGSSTVNKYAIDFPVHQLQIDLTINSLKEKPFPKYDSLCYIGSKVDDRLAYIESFHPETFGFISNSKRNIKLAQAYKIMYEHRYHLIVRQSNNQQIPLHRFLQTLAMGRVPVLFTNNNNYVNDKFLASQLTAKDDEELVYLATHHMEFLPSLVREYNYWWQPIQNMDKWDLSKL